MGGPGWEKEPERAVTRSVAHEQCPREVKNLDIDMNCLAAVCNTLKCDQQKVDPIDKLTNLKHQPSQNSTIKTKNSENRIPRNCKDIMNMKPCDKVKWLEAAEHEFTSMKERQVWTPIKLSKVLPGKRLFRTKWVFEEK